LKGTAGLSSSVLISAVNKKRKLGVVQHGQWMLTAQIVLVYI